MKSTYNNFIGTYTNVYPQDFCSMMIEEFQRLKEHSLGWDRQTSEGASKIQKDDYAINMNHHALLNRISVDNNEWSLQQVYREGLFRCINDYIDQYDALGSAGQLVTSDIKMQETRSGQGYHVWHHEHSALRPERVLTFIVYLNTLSEEENGTTEFIYQQQFVKPIENTVVVWPAGFTHPHRGNPVYGDAAKYIITGWCHYDSSYAEF